MSSVQQKNSQAVLIFKFCMCVQYKNMKKLSFNSKNLNNLINRDENQWPFCEWMKFTTK